MILKRAKEILLKEAEAIQDVATQLDHTFTRAVDLILSGKGKVVTTGIGKSGLIAQKIASTFSSTGTPSFFLHPAEALHGDLGMVEGEDILLAISNSGEALEVVRITSTLKRIGVKAITIASAPDSSLAKLGDIFLRVNVPEACGFGFIPTSSTTATMALGDALAVTVLEKRGFTQENFAFLHPGGALGKRLLLKVEELMHVGDRLPIVTIDTSMKDTIYEISSKRLGVTSVCDLDGKIVGVITDGDLRRAIERDENLLSKTAKDIMTRNPKRIRKDALASEAIQKMEEYSITSLFVVDLKEPQIPIGIVHIHDLLKAGVH